LSSRFIVPALVAGLALSGPVGCADIDLGATPFICHGGTPTCPPGYVCRTSGNKKVCVKEGEPLPKLDSGVASVDKSVTPVDSGAAADFSSGPDLAVRPDMSLADTWPWPPDKTVYLDKPPLKPDKTVPKLGCQSNKECKQKDPQNPCCCPITIIWVCAPLCLNPICLPI